MFPHGRCLSKNKVQGLLNDIAFYCVGECPNKACSMFVQLTGGPDRETSTTSTSPYDLDTLNRFREIVKDIRTHGKQPKHYRVI